MNSLPPEQMFVKLVSLGIVWAMLNWIIINVNNNSSNNYLFCSNSTNRNSSTIYNNINFYLHITPYLTTFILINLHFSLIFILVPP